MLQLQMRAPMLWHILVILLMASMLQTMRDIEAKSYGKPVSQGSKSPEWMKKENQTMDYFSQVCGPDQFATLFSFYQFLSVYIFHSKECDLSSI
jgi:hypothetical protein